jgi:hypothetical protein
MLTFLSVETAQHTIVYCALQINVILARQALTIVHSVWAQTAILLINVSVLILLFMILSTSATHPPTIASLAQTHYALTVPLLLQAPVLRV